VEENTRVEERFQRHWDMLDVKALHDMPIKIIGTGSVGSFTALALVKMGAQNVEVWDDDIIDEHNISNQFFRIKDIGEYKVDALQSLISEFEEVSIINNPVKYSGNEDKLEGIVIVALDSMMPRKRIWEKCKNNPRIKLFIDPRMGGRVARIYSVNPFTGGDEYEKTLYHDDDSAPERCTERTIIYNVLGIASLVCKSIEDYLNSGCIGCKEVVLDYATYTMLNSVKV
jgi:molybdopterin/thiamine biosynthesis adenylyltransferase